jgi:RNA-directed DNA polymerase
MGVSVRMGPKKSRMACVTGLSRKGYWHLAKTYATNCGLSKEYLEGQGLVSLRTLWIGIHYPATAR